MSDVKERGYYMVRIGVPNPEDIEDFLQKNVVAVGWSDVSIEECENSEAVREAVRITYYTNSKRAPQKIGKDLNETARFKNIKEGDYILIPYPASVFLAIAGTKEKYSENDKPRDLANQREVTFQQYTEEKLKEIVQVAKESNEKINEKFLAYIQIPRNSLTERLQRRLRMPGTTVADLSDFAGEIEEIFKKAQEYSADKILLQKEQEVEINFLSTLRENIENGKTFLQAGGKGLEKLVCELMICEGYDANLLSNKTFGDGADADIQATRSDSFFSANLLVQVKHHQDESDEFGVNQLINALNEEKWKKYQGCFVTTAKINDEATALAKQKNINLIDGKALVELILNNFSKLHPSTLRKLGISSIPQLLL